MRRLSLRINVGSSRVWIDRAILAANVKNHHLGVVIGLETQPVPANLFGLKLVREEFMVHPTRAAPCHFLGTEIDRAIGRNTGERNIVRGVAQAIRLLADAVLTVNDGGF